jgi:hypothetical protein
MHEENQDKNNCHKIIPNPSKKNPHSKQSDNMNNPVRILTSTRVYSKFNRSKSSQQIESFQTIDKIQRIAAFVRVVGPLRQRPDSKLPHGTFIVCIFASHVVQSHTCPLLHACMPRVLPHRF